MEAFAFGEVPQSPKTERENILDEKSPRGFWFNSKKATKGNENGLLEKWGKGKSGINNPLSIRRSRPGTAKRNPSLEQKERPSTVGMRKRGAPNEESIKRRRSSGFSKEKAESQNGAETKAKEESVEITQKLEKWRVDHVEKQKKNEGAVFLISKKREKSSGILMGIKNIIEENEESIKKPMVIQANTKNQKEMRETTREELQKDQNNAKRGSFEGLITRRNLPIKASPKYFKKGNGFQAGETVKRHQQAPNLPSEEIPQRNSESSEGSILDQEAKMLEEKLGKAAKENRAKSKIADSPLFRLNEELLLVRDQEENERNSMETQLILLSQFQDLEELAESLLEQGEEQKGNSFFILETKGILSKLLEKLEEKINRQCLLLKIKEQEESIHKKRSSFQQMLMENDPFVTKIEPIGFGENEQKAKEQKFQIKKQKENGENGQKEGIQNQRYGRFVFGSRKLEIEDIRESQENKWTHFELSSKFKKPTVIIRPRTSEHSGRRPVEISTNAENASEDWHKNVFGHHGAFRRAIGPGRLPSPKMQNRTTFIISESRAASSQGRRSTWENKTNFLNEQKSKMERNHPVIQENSRYGTNNSGHGSETS